MRSSRNNAGKGSARRATDVSKFNTNWELAFGKKAVAEKPLVPQQPKVVINATDVKKPTPLTFFELRQYQILDNRGRVEACAQFMYKGYQISLSTVGLEDGCHQEVFIFMPPTLLKGCGIGFSTVEEAIDHVNMLAKTTV